MYMGKCCTVLYKFTKSLSNTDEDSVISNAMTTFQYSFFFKGLNIHIFYSLNVSATCQACFTFNGSVQNSLTPKSSMMTSRCFETVVTVYDVKLRRATKDMASFQRASGRMAEDSKQNNNDNKVFPVIQLTISDIHEHTPDKKTNWMRNNRVTTV